MKTKRLAYHSFGWRAVNNPQTYQAHQDTKLMAKRLGGPYLANNVVGGIAGNLLM